MNANDIKAIKKALSLLTKTDRKYEKRLIRQAKAGNFKGLSKTRKVCNGIDKAYMLLDEVVERYYKHRR